MTTGAAQGADGAAAAELIDDGFTPEERTQFEAMEKETSGDPGGGAGGTDAGTGTGGAADAGTGGADKGVDKGKAGQLAEAEAAAAAGVAGAEDDDEDEPAAGAAAAVGTVGADGKPPPRRVAYGKFQRMEERAKKAETERAELAQNFARADERLKLLGEALTAGQQRQAEEARDDDPEPDPDKDVFGWIQWSRRDRDRLKEIIASGQQRSQVSEQEQQVASTYIEDARAYQAREPMFAHAYQFLMDGRTLELAEMYFGKDLTDKDTVPLTVDETRRIKAEIAAEERELVQESLKAKSSPAARLFRLAKARGFRPEMVQQRQQADAGAAGGEQAGQAGQAGQNGAAAGGGAQGGKQSAPTVRDEIERIKQGKAGSMSLSDAGAAPGSTGMPTAEKLAAMSGEEFNELMDRLTPAEQRRVMGG